MSDNSQLESAMESLNAQFFGEGSRLRLEVVDLDELREQDINANVMDGSMFHALVGNIKRNGALESVPLVANEAGDDKLQIVSGHHRVRSSREAGIARVLVLRYQDLSRAEIHAKQLAHNSINGQSDPEVVAQIFKRIDDLDLQLEAFIDPKKLGDVPEPVQFSPADFNQTKEARGVTFLFLPSELKAIDSALAYITSQTESVYLARAEEFEEFREALQKVRAELDIKKAPTAMAEMARLAMAQLKVEKGDPEHGS